MLRTVIRDWQSRWQKPLIPTQTDGIKTDEPSHRESGLFLGCCTHCPHHPKLSTTLFIQQRLRSIRYYIMQVDHRSLVTQGGEHRHEFLDQHCCLHNVSDSAQGPTGAGMAKAEGTSAPRGSPDFPKGHRNEMKVTTCSSQVFSHLILIHELLSIRLKPNLNIVSICSALFTKIICTQTIRW
uniref:Uncharacterized protein n=1 Tax=Rousettus aegyptiacus TaxID=9407 RepID=A0A7J8DIU4_ROUAE|nr:hypothetical protein HJG63_008695 [Rousettus aegyptiacus]